MQNAKILKEKEEGVLYSKGAFGKWSKNQATGYQRNPKGLKLEEDLLPIQSTSEVWTRFEFLYREVPCLVVKLWSGYTKR